MKIHNSYPIARSTPVTRAAAEIVPNRQANAPKTTASGDNIRHAQDKAQPPVPTQPVGAAGQGSDRIDTDAREVRPQTFYSKQQVASQAFLSVAHYDGEPPMIDLYA